jgi:glycosyltransferase involved in cell wall biosynthesis
MAGRRSLVYAITLAEVGGAQSYVRNLLPVVSEHYDVTVAAHGDGPLRAAAEESGIPFVPLRHVRRAISPVEDTRGLVELTRLFRRVRPDIVHLNSSKAGILGRLAATVARVPVTVFTVHGWAFKASSGRSAQLYFAADRVVRSLATAIVCVSQNDLDLGLAAGVSTADRTVLIRNAVDVSSEPAPRPPAPPVVEVVSIGRLALPKDFGTLLRAVALLPPGTVRLTLLGDGPLRPSLERLAAELRLEDVVFAGEVEDVRPYLAAADVFVLSSTSEGMPISVLEAMAAGRPIVASNVGGIPEAVVDGATGFLVPAARPDQLADALRQLLEDGDLRRRLGEEGRRRAVELFSLANWRQRHLELYDELLAARR